MTWTIGLNLQKWDLIQKVHNPWSLKKFLEHVWLEEIWLSNFSGYINQPYVRTSAKLPWPWAILLGLISRVKKTIASIHSIRPHLEITISVCKLEPLQKKATKMVKEFQKHMIWETAEEMRALNWETRRLEDIKSWLYSIWRMAGKTRIRLLSHPKGKHWWFSLQKRRSSSCRSTLAYYTWRSVSHSVMSDSLRPHGL